MKNGKNGHAVPELKPHPLAEIFPLMDGKTYQELKADIKQNGLQEPITLFEGKILDGRNRYRACLELGIEPKCLEFDGDYQKAQAWSVSLNLHRRHLTDQQRAIIAAKMAKLKRGQKRGPIGPLRDYAKLMKVSEKSVKRAKRVLKSGASVVVRALEEEKISLGRAEQIVQKSVPEQVKLLRSKSAFQSDLHQVSDSDTSNTKTKKNKKQECKDPKVDKPEKELLQAREMIKGLSQENQRLKDRVAQLESEAKLKPSNGALNAKAFLSELTMRFSGRLDLQFSARTLIGECHEILKQ